MEDDKVCYVMLCTASSMQLTHLSDTVTELSL